MTWPEPLSPEAEADRIRWLDEQITRAMVSMWDPPVRRRKRKNAQKRLFDVDDVAPEEFAHTPISKINFD